LPKETLVVGFIGLGKMGLPMARNVLRKYPLVVWNRTVEKARALEREGALVAASPREVALRADVVVTMLAKPEVSEKVILGLGDYSGIGVVDGVSRGKVVVNMATDPPDLARRLAERLAEKGASYVAAPVLGSVKHAESAKLTILADGDRNAFERVKPVLEAMGEKVIYVGPTGTANALKILMNMNLLISTAAFAEVLLLGERMGVDPGKVVEVFNESIFRSYITEYKAPQMVKRDWRPGFTIELAAKDLSLALEQARRTLTPALLASVTRELLEAALAQGLRDLDYAAIFKVYETLAGRSSREQS
jgi:3-hydroxyisobutyrate dehydrogenase